MSAAIPSGSGRYEASDRVIGYAVLLSLLLHGALLFSFNLRPSKGRQAPLGPITAHLAAPPASVPVARPEPPKAEPKAEPKPEPPKPRVERPIVKPSPVAKPSPVPVPKPTPAAPEPTPAPPPEAVKPQAPAPAVASSAPSQAMTPTPSNAEAEAREAFLSQLIKMANKYKRYPRVAMDNNWEGRAVVRLVIGANGLTSSIQILNSAGHEVLDKEAQQMVQRARPLVQIPPALRGKEFVIEVPVTYKLAEPG